MVEVCASLLAANYARMGEEVARATQAGVDSFHFDMMDGHYVPNLALAPDHLTALRPYTRLPFGIHLELDNPDSVLDDFRPFSADLVIACLDTLADPPRTFERIRRLGARAGFSLNPDEALDRGAGYLHAVDVLLILGVFPGFGGQPMAADTPDRVAQAARLRQDLGLQFKLAVDGGVNLENTPALLQAGADVLVIGSALFGAADMPAFVRQVRAIAAGPRSR